MLAVTAPVHAALLRYALIVGNNTAVDSDADALPPLLHAQTEAARLREVLVSRSNFHPSSTRTVLLLDATRAELSRAADALASQIAHDRARVPNAQVLFAFFFTGHGRPDGLLLADGRLSANGLAGVFRQMQADLSVGMVDACHSGTLDPRRLLAKGLKATPGVNLFSEMPKEILHAKGSVWFLSSGAGEDSYEDPQLGGVFTHFFIEALEKAPSRGLGITVDSIWLYARERTVRYTAGRGRSQHPRIVNHFEADGPVYLSFTRPASASLMLGQATEGQFALHYDGQPVITFDKARGTSEVVRVFPGRSELVVTKGGREQSRRQLTFAPGQTVYLDEEPAAAPPSPFGRVHRTLWSKGRGDDFVAVTEDDGVTMFAGVGYELSEATDVQVAPRHLVALSTRVDVGAWVGDIGVAYGVDRRRFGGWGYEVQGLQLRGAGGYGWDLARARLTTLLGVEGGALWQRYDDDAQRGGWSFGGFAATGGALALDERWVLQATVKVGARRGLGVGMGAGPLWRPYGGIGAGVLARLF